MVAAPAPPRRAVFLDRDGVINRAVVRDGKPYPPPTLDDFTIEDGVPAAIARLRAAGLWIVVVTNQPDVATGRQRREVVEAMHERLTAAALCDAIQVCYHTADDDCHCRKPRPGMLLTAADAWQIDLRRSFMVGDRWVDVAAGRAAGCYTFWINRGYAEPAADAPDALVGSLPEAAERILQQL
jgi:D-glycero-D-manno-heptose 1,7-bisphosphate phosphatase